MLPRKVSVDELFAEFGTDLPEDRELDSKLCHAIDLTRSGDWRTAIQIFHEYLDKYPDYDVPHIWLADFTKRNEGPEKAIQILRDSARGSTSVKDTVGEFIIRQQYP